MVKKMKVDRYEIASLIFLTLITILGLFLVFSLLKRTLLFVFAVIFAILLFILILVIISYVIDLLKNARKKHRRA